MKQLNLFTLYFFYQIILLSEIILCDPHSKEEWKSRSVYQLLTDRFAKTNDNDTTKCTALNEYCGGTFKGIKNHLDYIAGMGFNAIWISPPLKNKEGSYHGYHNIDINSINENFGTEQDLKDLISECHNRDIWVILDAVPNHMAGDLDISTFIPFNKPEHYHQDSDLVGVNCNNWDKYNQTIVENCRIWGMPDLKQENNQVKDQLISWLKNTLNNYGFDGIRYADVPNVPKWFWGEFTANANTYTLGIVGVDSADEKDVDYTVDYQNYMDGVGNYPLYYKIRENFCSTSDKQGSMDNLNKFIQNLQKKFLEPQYMGIWLGNHDKDRFLFECPQNISLRNAIVFTFFFEGIPIFYYGDEQYFNGKNENDNQRETLFDHYNDNSEIYQLLKKVNEIRKTEKIYETEFVRRYHDTEHYVFTRGNVLIAVGTGDTTSTSITLNKHGFKEGDRLCNALSEGDCLNVENNEITFTLAGEPKIYIKQTSENTRSGGSRSSEHLIGGSSGFLGIYYFGLILSFLLFL